MFPYLFLLLSEVMSGEIIDAKRRRLVIGIKLGRNLALLHLPFMDDMFFFYLDVTGMLLLSVISYSVKIFDVLVLTIDNITIVTQP